MPTPPLLDDGRDGLRPSLHALWKAQTEAYAAWRARFPSPPLPWPTRRERWRWWWRKKRHLVALWIAPWLAEQDRP